MTENAWPFLIGRAKHAGYRVVVVPDFMADAASVDALSGAARDVRLPRDTACARELRGLECGPVTVVYRSFSPRADDYGLGEDALTDGFGRPVRVIEGVVLRSAAAAGLPEIKVADLDRAHSAVGEAYRDFWGDDRGFVRRTSVGVPLGTGGHSAARPVRLDIAEPWRSARADTSVRELVAPEPRERRPRRALTAVAIGSVVVVAGLVVGAQLLTGALRGKPAETPSSVLRDFCHALKAGHLDEAYGYTSPQLHGTVSLPGFDKELLSTAARATTCTYANESTSGPTAKAILTLATGPTAPRVWNVTLVHGGGASWLINELVPASKAVLPERS
jgi:hypothetical protein